MTFECFYFIILFIVIVYILNHVSLALCFIFPNRNQLAKFKVVLVNLNSKVSHNSVSLILHLAIVPNACA